MKKTKKLVIKKVTLQNLEGSTLDKVAGGITGTCYVTCPKTCSVPPHEKLGRQRLGVC